MWHHPHDNELLMALLAQPHIQSRREHICERMCTVHGALGADRKARAGGPLRRPRNVRAGVGGGGSHEHRARREEHCEPRGAISVRQSGVRSMVRAVVMRSCMRFLACYSGRAPSSSSENCESIEIDAPQW